VPYGACGGHRRHASRRDDCGARSRACPINYDN